MNVKIIFLITLFSLFLCAWTEDNATTHPLMKKFDQNKDGKISYPEASKELQDDFCQYDINQDGYLDDVEVKRVK